MDASLRIVADLLLQLNDILQTHNINANCQLQDTYF